MRRVCFTLQVDPSRLDEYREHHARVWPEMLEALRDAGWHDYSLFLREDGLLVGYFLTDDLAAALSAMERTEVNARWQARMAPFLGRARRVSAGLATPGITAGCVVVVADTTPVSAPPKQAPPCHRRAGRRSLVQRHPADTPSLDGGAPDRGITPLVEVFNLEAQLQRQIGDTP